MEPRDIQRRVARQRAKPYRSRNKTCRYGMVPMFSEIQPVQYFGMLYIAGTSEIHANLKSASPIDVYVRCAALCAQSFHVQGETFGLVTNNKELVEARITALEIFTMAVVEHRFSMTPPAGSGFYSAHFKLELIDAFGKGQYGPYCALVDIDTVLLRKIDYQAALPFSLLAYDISDQIFADTNRGQISADLELVAGTGLREIKWWGGEFLLGSVAGFRELADKLASVWPNYVRHHKSLHHNGDEMVTTAALLMLEEEGFAVKDVGRLRGVTRWWSARTDLPMARFGDVVDCSLLHLPADKSFLAGYGRKSFFAKDFVGAYRSHLKGKAFTRKLVGLAKTVLGRGDGKFVPRL